MASVSEISSKIVGGATKVKPMKWLREKYKIDAEKALALTTVSSIIIKDGVGCAMYVNQSLHNEKIPDKKRKFVAALDLTNGVLMIGAQIALFFAMRKFSEPIFDKMFRKSFNAKNAKVIPTRIRMQQAQAGETSSRKLEIEKAYKEARKDGLDLFKFIADIAAATIVGKRIVVPFIATPLASKVEKWMNKNDQSQQSNEGTKTEDKSNPSMQGQGAYPKPYTVNTVRVIHPTWFDTAQRKQ
ncbi:MAG: hypothetical protein NC191_08450 [Muribaculaceae bacterium]|nr:hypothetical protein [Muribaculaceae bacterium]